MAIQPRSTTRPYVFPAATPQRRADVPQLFTVTHDHSRVKSANPTTRAQAREKQHLWGVMWTEGGVNLSDGTYHTSKVALEHWLDERGIYTLTWLADGSEEGNE